MGSSQWTTVPGDTAFGSYAGNQVTYYTHYSTLFGASAGRHNNYNDYYTATFSNSNLGAGAGETWVGAYNTLI